MPRTTRSGRVLPDTFHKKTVETVVEVKVEPPDEDEAPKEDSNGAVNDLLQNIKVEVTEQPEESTAAAIANTPSPVNSETSNDSSKKAKRQYVRKTWTRNEPTTPQQQESVLNSLREIHENVKIAERAPKPEKTLKTKKRQKHRAFSDSDNDDDPGIPFIRRPSRKRGKGFTVDKMDSKPNLEALGPIIKVEENADYKIKEEPLEDDLLLSNIMGGVVASFMPATATATRM